MTYRTNAVLLTTQAITFYTLLNSSIVHDLIEDCCFQIKQSLQCVPTPLRFKFKTYYKSATKTSKYN